MSEVSQPPSMSPSARSQRALPLRHSSTSAARPRVQNTTSGASGVTNSAPPITSGIATHIRTPIRLEIPPTRNHWEGVYVGEHTMLARGWERQLDQKYNALYYGTIVTPDRYRQWLDHNAIQYVALSDAPSDFAAKSEADLLIENKLPFLRLVWQDRHWKLYKVAAATPLLAGPGRLVSATPDSLRTACGRFRSRYQTSPAAIGTAIPACKNSTRRLVATGTCRRTSPSS